MATIVPNSDGVAVGTSASEKINGNAKPNTMLGYSGNDTIRGGGGHDFIDGGKGNDKIYGDSGDDFIAGAFGRDTLTGGSGKDMFVFDVKPSNSTADIITDFSVTYDTIALFKDVFTGAGKSNTFLKSTAFWTGTKAHDSSDRVVYNKTTGAIYYDADGTGSKAAVQIAKVNAGLKLTYKDFFILDV
jgi:Ca2+-binding RTX toxin-like protein